jgi:N-acetylglucosaminyl-diphospho-decaprenol L-rhamnosyltransferase
VPPALSIVIVNYNSAPDTIACVAALQTSRDCVYEIVVVDNDSRPDDRALLDGLEGVSLVFEEVNAGFGAGCNRGSDHASGRYLLFVNPDIVVRSATTLAELVAAAEASADLGALGCQIVYEDDRPQPSAHSRYPNLASHAWDYTPVVSSQISALWPRYSTSLFSAESHAQDTLIAKHLLGAFLLVPRAVFRGVGGFDEGFFLYREETDLCQRIATLGLRILYVPRPVVVHHAGTSTGNRFFVNLDPTYMESTYRYLRLRHGATYVSIAWLLALAGMILSVPYAHLHRAVKKVRGGVPPDVDALTRLLPGAIGWHLRHRRDLRRPVSRRFPPMPDYPPAQ